MSEHWLLFFNIKKTIEIYKDIAGTYRVSKEVYISDLALISVSILFTFGILLSTLCVQSNRMSKSFRILSIIHIFGYFAAYIVFLVGCICNFIKPILLDHDIIIIIYCIGNIFYIFGAITFGFILLHRLHIIFKDTAYKLSPILLRIYLTGIIIIILLAILLIFTFVPYLLITILILYFTITTSIIVLFNRNIFRLVLLIHRRMSIDTDNINLSNRQIALINSVTKNAYLCTFSFVWFVIANGYRVQLLFASIRGSIDIDETQIIIHNVVLCLAVCIETSCIYLSFAYNNSKYDALCGCCHDRLQLCCERSATKKIEKEKAKRQANRLNPENSQLKPVNIQMMSD